MRKIKVAQIGVNAYSHGMDIFDNMKKHDSLFELAGYVLPEKEKERFHYWYKKQLQLTYCAILIDKDIRKIACTYMGELMCRYSHSEWSYIMKIDFIQNFKKLNVISKERYKFTLPGEQFQ